MGFTKVSGSDKGNIRLYGLSTCIWCKRTKQFLDDLGVGYEYVFVDLLEGAAREECINEIKRWNERASFPTIVFDGKSCIVGFKEDEIKKTLGM